jgi:hypothetical protein
MNGASHRKNFDTPPLRGSCLGSLGTRCPCDDKKRLTELWEPIAFPVFYGELGTMPLLDDSATTVKKGAVRGREIRNQSVNTKLTPTELAAVEIAATADGCTLGEWVRDVILRRVRQSSSNDPSLAEIVGVRLLLVNVLRPLAAGQRLTTEEFDKLIDEISEAKHQLANQLLTSARGK